MSSPTFLQSHLSSQSIFPSTYQPNAAKEIRVQLTQLEMKYTQKKKHRRWQQKSIIINYTIFGVQALANNILTQNI